MTKQNHKTGFLVAGMVFCAILLRVLGKFDILIAPGGNPPLADLYRPLYRMGNQCQ